jgi:hypothetical protein
VEPFRNHPQRLPTSAEPPNLKNLSGRELGRVDVFATGRGSVSAAIEQVGGMRIPAKVVGVVVRLVAVVVAALHPFRSGADEGRQDEMGDSHPAGLTANAKRYSPASSLVGIGLEDSRTRGITGVHPHTLNSSVIANPVAGEPRHV